MACLLMLMVCYTCTHVYCLEQMAVGLRIIENAHRNRVESLVNELKALRINLEEKTNSVCYFIVINSFKLSNAQRRNNALESELIENKQKQTQLLDENAKLLTTIKRLQRDVTRLEAVRQAVLTSINGENGEPGSNDIYKSEDYLRSSAPVTLRELQMDDAYHPSQAATRLSPARSNSNIFAPQHMNRSDSVSQQQHGVDEVDGRAFFKMARSLLTADCFKSFLDHIKKLNSHEQTRDETLLAAHRLFGDSHSDLLNQFKLLLDRHSN